MVYKFYKLTDSSVTKFNTNTRASLEFIHE